MADPSTGQRHKKGKSVPAVARQIVGSAIQRPDSDVMHNSMLAQQKSTIEFFEAEEDIEWGKTLELMNPSSLCLFTWFPVQLR